MLREIDIKLFGFASVTGFKTMIPESLKNLIATLVLKIRILKISKD